MWAYICVQGSMFVTMRLVGRIIEQAPWFHFQAANDPELRVIFAPEHLGSSYIAVANRDGMTTIDIQTGNLLVVLASQFETGPRGGNLARVFEFPNRAAA